MNIQFFARKYALKAGVSPGYLEQLVVFTKRLDWQIEDVTVEMVDEYLTQALKTLSPATVANHRRMLRTLLLEAQKQGLNTCILHKFRRVKCPQPVPVAWSLDEIRQLVHAARNMHGNIRGLQKASLLEAWLLTAYATGLRAGDLITLRWDQIRGRRIYRLQNKTSTPIVSVLTDEAFAACKALPRRDLVFGEFAALNTIQQWVSIVVKNAGLSGSTKWLRRSGATYSKVHGRSPKAFLGHLTDGLAERNYVDQLLYEQEAGIHGEPLPSVLSH